MFLCFEASDCIKCPAHTDKLARMALHLSVHDAHWVFASIIGGLAAGLLLHASTRLAGRLAALEQRITCLETHCESLAVEVENAAFMSKHNAEVASVLCERVGWSLEHEPLAAPK